MGDHRSKQEEPPASAYARIFVGNLNPATITDEQILEVFSRHGRVLEVVIRKNFAFVQFDTPEEAATAIKKEDGGTIQGRRVNISLAKPRPEFPPQARGGGDHPPQARGGGGDHPPQYKPQDQQNRRSDYGSRKRHGSGGNDSPPRWGSKEGRHYEREDHRRSERSSYNRRSSESWTPQRQPLRQQYDSNDEGRHRRHHEEPRRESRYLAPSRPNDVEIVCSNRSITDYAESIEGRLKASGLLVDILYPNPDFPLSKILESITERGVRFAMLLTPLSMEHSSASLNVLQGPTQEEHRNMPLEEVFSLILSTSSSGSMRPPSREREGRRRRHPREINELLELLLSNKRISLRQMDEVINYLMKHRDEVAEEEEHASKSRRTRRSSGEPGPSHEGRGYNRSAGGEYYDKILNILTNKDPSDPFNGGPPSSHQEESNPSLQKAIDSLIKSGPNLLNQIKNMDAPASRGPSNSEGNPNNVLNNYYSSLFKNEGRQRHEVEDQISGRGGRNASGSSSNLFMAYGDH
eukprot:TRINITY_DN2247_c0_g1_i1.p1 TRINITY_DN2247_c0_g1~~TRINITY_DN2247_c0_g1_i1.p1  ORF type:complete len:521 (+),score=152.00 TRINITY_DN2247_c0_g1_i1:242-1804(+)